MLVIDASALAEYLIGSELGGIADSHLQAHAGRLHLPHLAIIETASVFRSWTARGEVPEHRAQGAISNLRDFPATRWPVDPFLPRIWELRHNLSAYDAAYVALAEALGATLVTTDARIAIASGHLATVQLLA